MANHKRTHVEPRDRPMFFRGQQQSEEFARGAWALRDAMAKWDAQPSPRPWAVEQQTPSLAEAFNANIAIGGDYTRGFVTALAEYVTFHEIIGAPALDVWRPLAMNLRYTSRGAHPTPGSKLFEYRGFAVSVAPDQTVHTWRAGEDHLERSSIFLQQVSRDGQLLSLRAFDALRAKAKTAEVTNG